MDFDFDRHLRAVERSVSSPEREGKPARAVSISRIYATTAEDHWDEYGPGATGVGWELALLGLDHHFTRPDETEFATSPEGRAFIAGSSNAWAHAAIVAGAEDSAAQAAANRATVFYTGEPALIHGRRTIEPQPTYDSGA